jgi:hypothetical protein
MQLFVAGQETELRLALITDCAAEALAGPGASAKALAASAASAGNVSLRVIKTCLFPVTAILPYPGIRDTRGTNTVSRPWPVQGERRIWPDFYPVLLLPELREPVHRGVDALIGDGAGQRDIISPAG